MLDAVQFSAEYQRLRSTAAQSSLKTYLVELWLVLSSLSPLLVQRNGMLKRDALKRDAAEAKKGFLAGRIELPDITNVERMLAVLAAHLSAADDALYEMDGARPPLDPNTDWVSKSSVGEIYAVPRVKPLRVSGGRAPRFLVSARDLCVHHRFIPVKLHGYRVRLTWREMPSEIGLSSKMGAAFFPNMVHKVVDSNDGFLVASVTAVDQESAVKRHVESAHTDGCSALVFPELSMPPDVLQVVRRHLGTKLAWASEEVRNRQVITVAGSWHVHATPKARNVAPVLDSYGNLILEHKKLTRYGGKDGKFEDIDVGDVVEVLVTEDAIVAFAICLDYCGLKGNNPYLELDVDYVLVPSWGNDITMLGHRTTAGVRSVKYRSRDFVVQQFDKADAPKLPDGTVAIGYVLPALNGENASVIEHLVQNDWNVRIPG